jgi:hypothetical protein
MMTIANSVYANLKKRGFHNWGFLNISQSDFDFNDLDDEAIDPDWYLIELEE